MKQRCVGEHTIEMTIRQIELKKILLPYLAAAVDTRHCDDVRCALQTHGKVAEFGKYLEVAPGPAAEIEYRERQVAFDALQQRRDILADVVIAGALPELFGTAIVMLQREVCDFFQVL